MTLGSKERAKDESFLILHVRAFAILQFCLYMYQFVARTVRSLRQRSTLFLKRLVNDYISSTQVSFKGQHTSRVFKHYPDPGQIKKRLANKLADVIHQIQPPTLFQYACIKELIRFFEGRLCVPKHGGMRTIPHTNARIGVTLPPPPSRLLSDSIYD